MRTKLPLLVLLPLLLLLLVASLAASPALALDGAGRWWSNPRLKERLGLSAGQIDAIEEITLRHRTSEIDQKAALAKVNLRLERLLDSDDIDEQAVRAAIEEISDLRCAMTRRELEARAEIAFVLTREQRMAMLRLRGALEERRDPARRGPRRR
jgi:Spy/CpxP family protein refolding chaperone